MLNQNIEEARRNPEIFFKYIKDWENFSFDHPYFEEIKNLKPLKYDAVYDALKTWTLDRVMGNNFEFIETEE